eukprot:3545194-Amphidinium_carterae.5
MRKGVATRIGGRPLGFLSLWLARGASFDNKDDHICKDVLRSYSYADRLAARHKLLSSPSGRELATFERQCEPDEDIEPAGMQGLA